jgi:myo-inositol-1(or 4)-monophosphatase
VSLDLPEALVVALTAAQTGADIVAQGYKDRDLTIRNKGLIDLVTQYDLGSERAIRTAIGAAYPDHDILAEEEGLVSANQSRPRWYVDPLDGTTNYVHRHPFFAVSIALALPNGRGFWEPVVGVIQAPVLRERFFAIKGQGAFSQTFDNGEWSAPSPLLVSSHNQIIEALVNTGFPYDVHERLKEIVSPFERMLGQAQAIRRAGAASLDLAFVAAGRAEGYWEAGLKPWDVAAGVLIVAEAKGRVSDLLGQEYVLEKSPIVLASNGFLHPILVSILNGQP